MTAELEPVVEPSGPATGPATQPAKVTPRPRLRPTRIVADGKARFQTQGTTVYAERIEYSPLTAWLLAHGLENGLVQVYNDDGTSQGQFGQVEYNVESGAIKMRDVRVRSRK